MYSEVKSPELKACGSCPADAVGTRRPSEIPVDSDSTEVESTTDEEERWKDLARATEFPSEYYTIQKLVKFAKSGNQTATCVALWSMLDYDLKEQIHQLAIMDIGGLETLVNILECFDSKCTLGALMVLKDICLNIDVRKSVVDLGGVPLIVDILDGAQKDLKIMAAEALATIAKVRLARKYVRVHRGIPKLVDMLDVKQDLLDATRNELDPEEWETLDMARSAARALWALGDSRHNIDIMRKTGVVPLMGRLLKCHHADLVLPIMGTIQKCASVKKFQTAITTENMIPDIVAHLRGEDMDLKKEGCWALYKVTLDEATCELLRSCGGLDTLVQIMREKSYRDNEPLMVGVTGAIWMACATEENITELENLRAVTHLVALLDDESDDVLTNSVGAISLCVRHEDGRTSLRLAGGIPLLINLMDSSHVPLLINLAKTVQQIALDPDCMHEFEDLDGVRLTWSLLRNDDPVVQKEGAYALCPCVDNATDSAELVRSLVGAMELCVTLLRSKDVRVLSAVCAAIAHVARDIDNLAILTDLKVIYRLADLVHHTDDTLRQHLADAIARCAVYGRNIQELGRLQAVTPIVGFMTSEDPKVHRTTAMALEKLSLDPQNCIMMHQSGAVDFLLECVGSTCKELQLSAATCLRNIRILALRTEEAILKTDEDWRYPK